MSHEQPIHGCQFIEIDGLSHMKYLLAGGGETEKSIENIIGPGQGFDMA